MFSLGVHIPEISGCRAPFTKYSKPSWVTRWPTTTTLLSRLTSDDLAGGILELAASSLALSTLLCALSSVTEFNHCNFKGALSLL